MNKLTDIEAYLNENGSVTYSNTGTSMKPLLRQGKDVFTIEKLSPPYSPGDVVLYRRASGALVLHRIVGKDESGYILLGDNLTKREYGVKEENILGVMTSFTRGGKTYSVKDAPYRLYSTFCTRLFPVRIALKKAAHLSKNIFSHK